VIYLTWIDVLNFTPYKRLTYAVFDVVHFD